VVAVPREARGDAQRTVFFRGAFHFPFRALVRMKLFQLLGGGAMAFPVAAAGFGAEVSAGVLLAAGTTAAGSLAATWALNFYGRRYVLEASVLEPARQWVRFSSLDFWGRRLDFDCHLSGEWRRGRRVPGLPRRPSPPRPAPSRPAPPGRSWTPRAPPPPPGLATPRASPPPLQRSRSPSPGGA